MDAVIIILVMAIIAAIAIHFAMSASNKGHSFGFWLFICLLTGPIGYAWVNSLPDLPAEAKVEELSNRIDNLEKLLKRNVALGILDSKRPDLTSQSASMHSDGSAGTASEGEWTCSVCFTVNKSAYGQCKKCGSYRNQLV